MTDAYLIYEKHVLFDDGGRTTIFRTNEGVYDSIRELADRLMAALTDGIESVFMYRTRFTLPRGARLFDYLDDLRNCPAIQVTRDCSRVIGSTGEGDDLEVLQAMIEERKVVCR